MPTFGITTAITMSTEGTRSNLNSFYKSFTATSVRMETPITIVSTENEVFDVSDSSFVIIVCDDYGLENAVLEVTLLNTDAETMTIKGVGFMMFDTSNLVTMTIENIGTTDVEVIVIY